MAVAPAAPIPEPAAVTKATRLSRIPIWASTRKGLLNAGAYHSALQHSKEAACSISPRTVRIHRRNIYAKLRINSQGELFARFIGALVGARQHGEN
ncbi:MAG: LuxR C-terminal-related transcriptional regulator [Rhodovibrio sp.]|nr:LuxR C-terminal-related transcriptional regulator [Rhodovibrio sp.]